MQLKVNPEWVLLAVGKSAEVYKVSATEAVKLFYPGYSLVAATEEYECTRLVNRVYDKTVSMEPPDQQQGRISLSMSLARGKSLSREMHFDKISENGLSLGLMHRNLHIRPSEGLPGAVSVFEPLIREYPGIPGKLKEKILIFLKNACNDRLCHGAFHPDHILEGPDGWTLIDWKYAFAGDPLADIAATLLSLAYGPGNLVLHRLILPRYLKGYFAREKVPLEDLSRWKVLAALRRIPQASPPERAVLKALVRRSAGLFP